MKQIFDVKGVTATLHFLVKERLRALSRQEDTPKQAKLSCNKITLPAAKQSKGKQ